MAEIRIYIDMNIPVIFQFLKELSANNNREWFNAHREQYENARNEFENLLTVIISRISLFDESIRGIEAKDCTYRIYRDTDRKSTRLNSSHIL